MQDVFSKHQKALSVLLIQLSSYFGKTKEKGVRTCYRLFWRGPEAKTSPMVWWDILVYFMEKKSHTKFCGVLISLHVVKKWKCFEFDVRDVIHVNVKRLHRCFCLQFYGERTFDTVLWCSWPFLTNLESLKILNH